MEVKEIEAAKFSFASAIYVEPENPDYQFAYGKLILEAEYYSEASKAFEKVIELQPDYPDAQRLRKLAREEKERLDREKQKARSIQ